MMSGNSLFFKGQSLSDLSSLLNFASNGDCEYYSKLESFKNCGTNGYPVGYGYKYCKKFGAFINEFKQDVLTQSKFSHCSFQLKVLQIEGCGLDKCSAKVFDDKPIKEFDFELLTVKNIRF